MIRQQKLYKMIKANVCVASVRLRNRSVHLIFLIDNLIDNKKQVYYNVINEIIIRF